jgi:hypothetical protein
VVPGYFDAWDAHLAPGLPGLAETVEWCVPPGATVLVMNGEEAMPEVHSRDTISCRPTLAGRVYRLEGAGQAA